MGVEFVEDDAVGVEPVLGIRLRAKYLIEGVGGFVDDALLSGEDFHAFG